MGPRLREDDGFERVSEVRVSGKWAQRRRVILAEAGIHNPFEQAR